ncbi:MAG: FliA/WhiG family RNA polymerase sigma factor [Candidatus Eremiobacteraeota bacterium]|nr:FliA/WhiG family RNA polymerase sigma factor [Candidatus Eremiobacteraeota bacterium]
MQDFGPLWEAYKNQGHKEAKDTLIELYMPLVKNIAATIRKKMRSGVDYEDLVSDGVFGLIRAIELFDSSRGVKFETYATPVIRGAIYNGLRSLDWVPERTRGKTRKLQHTMEEFVLLHGRQATQEELAEALEMSAEEVYNLITDLGCIYLLSLDQPVTGMEGEDIAIMDVIESRHTPDPYQEAEFKEIREILRTAIEHLDEREQLIIKNYYFEGNPFENSAKILGVSKQRISQIHSRALKKLKDLLWKVQIDDQALHNMA